MSFGLAFLSSTVTGECDAVRRQRLRRNSGPISITRKVYPFSHRKFIQTIVDFAIVAFVIFMAIKAMNALKKKEAAAPPAQEVLLTEIRDAIRGKQ